MDKKIVVIKAVLLASICTFCLHISCKGNTDDSWKVFIGKELILTNADFDPLRSSIKFLKLDSSNYQDTINIYFNGDSDVATDRQIKLMDTAGKVIRVWRFSDQTERSVMSIPITNVVSDLRLKQNGSFFLRYTDSQHSFPLFLTSVLIEYFNLDDQKAKSGFAGVGTTTIFFAFAAVVIFLFLFRLIRNQSQKQRN